MFDRQKKVKKKKLPRQEWKPNIFLRIAYYIWRMGFGAFKIALGALSTVLIIGVICAFVFVGVLGQYLQDDIIPQAQINIENLDMEKTSYVYYKDENGNYQILQQLAGGKRLVGIISHVTELKEQMDRKVVVRKTEKGSRITYDFS